MQQEVPLGDEIAEWACGVKERIAGLPTELEGPIQLDQDTFEQLTAALDLLLQPPPGPQGSSDPGADRAQTEGDFAHVSGQALLDLVDTAFARWQAQVAIAYSDSATTQLGQQLEAASQLTTQLRERETELQSRQTQIEQQQQQLQAQLADVLARESRLERQRKTLAGELRRRKAEDLLELAEARQRETADANHAAQAIFAKSLDGLRADLDQAHQQHTETKQFLAITTEDLAQAQSDLQQLSLRPESSSANPELLEKIDELQQSNARQVAKHQEQMAACEAEADAENMRLLQRIGELGDQHEQQTRQLAANEASHQQLETAQREIAQLQAALDAQADSASGTPAASQELEAAQEQIRELEARVLAQPDNLDNDEADQKLSVALAEIEELRKRNAELASQTANAKAIEQASISQESLTWEERKKLIMQQLDDESIDPESEAELQAKKLEIENVLKTTQAEIDRRDNEIIELQSIIEQQSNTSQGVAIGAAAIAQMFESDDLILEEREKLKVIQAEWEQKVRQAEIDISMERAKLARERNQIEAKMADLESRTPAESSPAADTTAVKGVRTRKWLEHLGLKEDPEK